VTLRQTRTVATSFFIESFRKWATNLTDVQSKNRLNPR
jgi:hypothetical protein